MIAPRTAFDHARRLQTTPKTRFFCRFSLSEVGSAFADSFRLAGHLEVIPSTRDSGRVKNGGHTFRAARV